MAEPTKQNIDTQKLIAHLKDKWLGRPCPMCQVGNWNVSDKVFELREFYGGGLRLGGVPIYPVIPVTCNNCGNTVFINPITAGVLIRDEKEAK